MKSIMAFAFIISFSTTLIAAPGYYRSPAINGNTLVFTAEGDLWIKLLNEPKATRLTTHAAEESQAKISRDGKQVAFVANYEGAQEVYVMPIKGGIAKRISFENSRVKVHGWNQKGEVLYSTNNRIGPTGNWTLKLVNPETLFSTYIPLADAVDGSIDALGEYIYFTQFGLQVSGDNVKYYRGGAMGEIWRYKLNSTNQEAIKLTADQLGSARQPMVANEVLYYISDASGRDNIWSMQLDGSHKQQITQYTDWSVRSANLDHGRIVFQLGADIKVIELANNTISNQEITLTTDHPYMRERWVNKPLKFLNSAKLTNKKKQIVLTARGRVAIASIDETRLMEIMTPTDSRTRSAILSNDGKWVYALNDASGEVEIWRFAADGSDHRDQLTDDGSTYRWQISMSPDGNWLAHDDYHGDLWLFNLKTNKNKKIISGGVGLDPYINLVWAPNSKALAITQINVNDERSRISLYSLENKDTHTLTSDKYNSTEPAFSPDGQWLYFLSDRQFNATPNSPWGDRNLGVNFDRRTQIFAYALNSTAVFPFEAANELSNVAVEKDGADDEKTTNPIQWGKLGKELWQVPVPSGNYTKLAVNKAFIYVKDSVQEPNTTPRILAIAIKPKTKAEVFVDAIKDFDLSVDGKHLFVQKEDADNANMFIVDAGAKFPADTQDLKLQVAGWQLLITPTQEWHQIFNDAWLLHRDMFFDPKLRQVNWQQVKKKYSPLLERVTDRYELNELFSQMMGELNALHSQVSGGDKPKIHNRAKAAVLGAALVQSAKSVMISHIYEYDPELPANASPLSKPGTDVENGDLIVTVNGKAIHNIAELNHALLNQTGKQVLLALQRTQKKKTKTIKTVIKTIVRPIDLRVDYRLRYNDWVTVNRKKVNSASTALGYVHLHAMGARDIADFAREFYAAYKQDGLIIDVRRNRGGNVDSWILEKLLRRAWMFWHDKVGPSNANMQQTFRGHLVVLADQFTYSDGETFTAGIKALNLAPVIGKQTAGAGVWLRGMNRVSDGGIARVAEFPQYAMDGRWIVEGKGISPTIEVDNLPHATFMGDDAQLDAAIKYLTDKLKSQPIKAMTSQPFSDAQQPANDF